MHVHNLMSVIKKGEDYLVNRVCGFNYTESSMNVQKDSKMSPINGHQNVMPCRRRDFRPYL